VSSPWRRSPSREFRPKNAVAARARLTRSPGEVFLSLSSRPWRLARRPSTPSSSSPVPSTKQRISTSAPAARTRTGRRCGRHLRRAVAAHVGHAQVLLSALGQLGCRHHLCSHFRQVGHVLPRRSGRYFRRRRCSAVAPKIAALRKKYGNDKQKLGVETMNLYKPTASRRLAAACQPDPNAPSGSRCSPRSTTRLSCTARRSFISPTCPPRIPTTRRPCSWAWSCSCKCACHRLAPISQQQKMMAFIDADHVHRLSRSSCRRAYLPTR